MYLIDLIHSMGGCYYANPQVSRVALHPGNISLVRLSTTFV